MSLLIVIIDRFLPYNNVGDCFLHYIFHDQEPKEILLIFLTLNQYTLSI